MDTSQKKRMIVLGAVAAVVAAVGIPYIISHPNATSNVVTTTAKSTGDSVKQNKASANKKAKNNDAKVSNEKLELNKLTHGTYSLQSAENNTSPFMSAVINNKANDKNKNNDKALPDTMTIGQHIDNNLKAVPTSVPVTFAPSDNGRSDFRLKAVAQTNDRAIAVIESGGKRVSAFVGTSIGNYTVTNIDSEHAYLQSNDGYALTLSLIN